MAKTIEQLTREVLKEILVAELKTPKTAKTVVKRKYIKSGKYTYAARGVTPPPRTKRRRKIAQ